MVRTVLVLAVLVALTTSTMRADPKVTLESGPAPSGPAAAAPAETSPVQGFMIARNVKYQLNHVAAVETNRHGKGNERICVIVSTVPIPAAIVNSLRKDKRPQHLFEPHVLITFAQEGQPIRYESWADNNNATGSPEEGELKIVGNRVTGYARDIDIPGTKYKSGFDFRFDAPLVRLDSQDTPADSDTQEIVLVGNADGEETDSPATSGNGLDFLKSLLLGNPVELCEGGNCGTVEFSGNCSSGNCPAPCPAPSFCGQLQEVGTFSVVSTPQGTIRIDTRTGEACLLSLGADGKQPQWIEIQDPPLCSSPAVANQGNFGPTADPDCLARELRRNAAKQELSQGPSVAPDEIPASAAAKIAPTIMTGLSSLTSSLTSSVKEQTPVTAVVTKEDDKMVAFKILEALKDANLRGFSMEIQLSKGVATLHGVLSTPQMRDLAAEVTGKVPGVKSVVNQLYVRWTPKLASEK